MAQGGFRAPRCHGEMEIVLASENHTIYQCQTCGAIDETSPMPDGWIPTRLDRACAEIEQVREWKKEQEVMKNQMTKIHECQFPEEETPLGTRILLPCLFCGLAAADALAQMEMRVYLTDEDKRRLRPLVESAIAEVEAAVEPGAMILPTGIEDAMGLITAYEWGHHFLTRLKQ